MFRISNRIRCNNTVSLPIPSVGSEAAAVTVEEGRVPPTMANCTHGISAIVQCMFKVLKILALLRE